MNIKTKTRKTKTRKTKTRKTKTRKTKTSNNTKTRKTKTRKTKTRKTKTRIGGNINNQKGLEKILSIGYEVECNNLIKLTETFNTGPNQFILYNSDSARKDMLEFDKNNQECNEESDQEDLEEDKSSNKSSICGEINERNEEVYEDIMYKYDDPNNKTNPGTKYTKKEVVFNITNDISKTPFSRKLNSLCQTLNEETSTIKDNLYRFRCLEKEENENENKEYDIHFMFTDKNSSCGNHSTVEWVFTYFKPTQSQNIILDTFVNMITNLVHHLSDLEPIPGNFLYTNNQEDESKFVIVDQPEERILYHKPDESLFYLQSHQNNKQLTIDDACSKLQMTFSANAEDIITVIIALTTDYTKYTHLIPENQEKLESYLKDIIQIQTCIDELFDNYYYDIINNKSNNSNKSNIKQILIQKQKGTKETKEKTKKLIAIIKNYLFLILFKINKYYYYYFYNSFNTKKLYNYLKDLLVFNSRHTNYVLYMALKEKIKELFDIVNDKEAIEIIKDIIFQKDILYKYLIDDYFKNDKDKNGEDKYQIDIELIFSREQELIPKKTN